MELHVENNATNQSTALVTVRNLHASVEPITTDASSSVLIATPFVKYPSAHALCILLLKIEQYATNILTKHDNDKHFLLVINKAQNRYLVIGDVEVLSYRIHWIS